MPFPKSKNIIVSGVALAALVACGKAPKEAVQFKPMSWKNIPGFEKDDTLQLREAFNKTCKRYKRKAPEYPLSEKNVEVFGTYGDWQNFCQKMYKVEDSVYKAFLKESLKPLQVQTKEGSLFTGYYAPHLEGSLKPQAGYNTALYGKPNNMYTARLGDFDSKLKGKTIVGRVVGNKFIPYATREEISNTFEVPENKDAETIVWLKNPVDAFFLHIQGSGHIKTPEGENYHVSYAGNNGHSYVAIGRTLIAKGLMKKEDVSLDSLRNWLKENPEKREEVFNSNPRYIFFGLSEKGHTKGSLGVNLTKERSLAVDPQYIPLGVPVFVDTVRTSDGLPFRKMMMAQDTGAAIKGAVRGDIYYGDGKEAGVQAGYQNSKGSLYVFSLKKDG